MPEEEECQNMMSSAIFLESVMRYKVRLAMTEHTGGECRSIGGGGRELVVVECCYEFRSAKAIRMRLGMTNRTWGECCNVKSGKRELQYCRSLLGGSDQ